MKTALVFLVCMVAFPFALAFATIGVALVLPLLAIAVFAQALAAMVDR